MNFEDKSWLVPAFEALLEALCRTCEQRQPTGMHAIDGVEIKVGDLVRFYVGEDKVISATPVSDIHMEEFVDVIVRIEGQFTSVSVDACSGKQLQRISERCTIVGNVFNNAARYAIRHGFLTAGSLTWLPAE